MKYGVIRFLILLLTGCTTPIVSTNTNTGSMTVKDETAQTTGKSNLIKPAQEDIIVLDFEDKNQQIVTTQHNAKQTITLVFNNNTVDTTLRIQLATPKNLERASIRIAQIIMPDTTMDGPFGLDQTYSLSQTGTYQFLIRESMMAGDPWTGKLIITSTLQSS